MSAGYSLLGDGTNDRKIIGDPNKGIELAANIIGSFGPTTLIEFVSLVQAEVTVAVAGGVDFPNRSSRAIETAFVIALLANPNFVDAITGLNTVVLTPNVVRNALLGSYPVGGIYVPQPQIPTVFPPDPSIFATFPGVIAITATKDQLLGASPLTQIVGDPIVPAEIAVGLGSAGGTLVRWNSPFQAEVQLPFLGGADFDIFIGDISNPDAAIKSIDAAHYAILMRNPNFLNATTGVNLIARQPSVVSTPRIAAYPRGGSSTVFVMPSLFPPDAPAVDPPEPKVHTFYPRGGTATTPLLFVPIPPPGGSFVPWSNADSLALAYATDQYL